MQILEISATKVYGYLDMRVEFNQDLTFIVGPNGCGKTTILYLMQLALSLSLVKLARISFNEISISIIDDNDKKHIIEYTNYRDVLTVFVSGIDFHQVEFKYFHDEPYSYTHIQRELFREVRYIPLIEFFRSISRPCFLNIERIDSEREIDADDIPRYDRYQRNRESLINQKQRLDNLASLVEQQYKIIADKKESVSENLYTDIFMSLFRVYSNNRVSIGRSSRTRSTERIKESVKTLINKTMPKSKITGFHEEIDRFFLTCDSNSEVEIFKSNDRDVISRYANYVYQLDRIKQLEETYNKYNLDIDVINEPIRLFEEAINVFFKDCSLTVSIDSVGKIVIHRPNGDLSDITELSSGETQLLIILAYLVFGAKIDNRIFIIDEPELSLHLKWQTMLADTIMSLKPNSQVILATHSPEIVGKYRSKGRVLHSYEKNETLD